MIKDKVEEKKRRRLRIKRSIRKKLAGTAERPRLTVYKSNRYLYVQAVDDERGHTLAFATTVTSDFKEFGYSRKSIKAAEKLGEKIGKILVDKGIKRVVFDRNGYPYHGRVKAIADGARKAGLEF